MNLSKKYRFLLESLKEYIDILVVYWYIAKGKNRSAYSERLAVAAHLFSLALGEDRIRFLKNVDAESLVLDHASVNKDAKKAWLRFYEKVAKWRIKHPPVSRKYPSSGCKIIGIPLPIENYRKTDQNHL